MWNKYTNMLKIMFLFKVNILNVKIHGKNTTKRENLPCLVRLEMGFDEKKNLKE